MAESKSSTKANAADIQLIRHLIKAAETYRKFKQPFFLIGAISPSPASCQSSFC